MSTITVPREDLTSEQVVKALRDGLKPGYEVLPGMRITRSSFVGPHDANPDSIVVTTGRNSVWRAQVTISREPGQTAMRVSAGGLLGIFVVNTFGIVREVSRVLATSADLRPS